MKEREAKQSHKVPFPPFDEGSVKSTTAGAVHLASGHSCGRVAPDGRTRVMGDDVVDKSLPPLHTSCQLIS